MKLNLKGKKILEIGIAGDEKPSGSYKFFGQGNKWTTMDIDAKWKPDIVADITNNEIPDGEYDLIIMTQTLEHVWDYARAIENIYRITRKYAIVDCPFMYEFHQDGSRATKQWYDWDDYWRFTPAAMKKLFTEVGFIHVDTIFNPLLTVCIAEK